jgi:hypothetical protein
VTHCNHRRPELVEFGFVAVGTSLLACAVRALPEWGHALRCKWIRPFGALSLCLAFGLLAGCTSSDGSTPGSDSSASVTTSISSSPAVTSISSPISSSSASLTSTPLTSTPPASSAPPWAADSTPDQVAEAQAAIAAYTGYWRVLDQALAEPGKDWSAEINQYATGTEADSSLEYLKQLAAAGQYASGSTGISPRVTKVEPALVTITDCVDKTDNGFFDKSGQSIKAPDVSGSFYRHASEIQVGQYVNGQWLVTLTTDDWTKTC